MPHIDIDLLDLALTHPDVLAKNVIPKVTVRTINIITSHTNKMTVKDPEIMEKHPDGMTLTRGVPTVPNHGNIDICLSRRPTPTLPNLSTRVIGAADTGMTRPTRRMSVVASGAKIESGRRRRSVDVARNKRGRTKRQR